MKKHKKSIIGVVLMVLITLGVYILFKGDGNSVFTGDDTTQAVEFNDINLNEEKDGKVIWNLKALNGILLRFVLPIFGRRIIAV